MALFAPGRDDLVYAMSLSTGLAVLKLRAGGAGARTVIAPVPAQWLSGCATACRWQPHPVFG
jgi:hypothetical protein